MTPTEQKLKNLLEELLGDNDLNQLPTIKQHNYTNDYCRWCGREFEDENTNLFCESDDCPGFQAREFLAETDGELENEVQELRFSLISICELMQKFMASLPKAFDPFQIENRQAMNRAINRTIGKAKSD